MQQSMSKKDDDDDVEEKKREQEQTMMLVGKIHRAQKKSSQRWQWLEKRRSRRTRRRRRRGSSSNSIIADQQHQKHRNVGGVGKSRGAVRSVPPSSLPPLCWSSTSLMCHLQSKHLLKSTCLESSWKWSKPTDLAATTILLDQNQQILFHPRTSSSTQVILADRPLPQHGKHYWEIYIPAVYGTAMMFGIATSEQKLSSSAFTNLIGLDQHGWALSHQGLLWHNGMAQAYLPRPMEALRPFLIGLEFDADARTLSYTIDNQSMGIAFRNLPTDLPIYPAVSSTSAQSTMILKHRCKSCSTLHDNCLKVLRSTELRSHLDHRWLPRHLIAQLIE